MVEENNNEVDFNDKKLWKVKALVINEIVLCEELLSRNEINNNLESLKEKLKEKGGGYLIAHCEDENIKYMEEVR